MAKSIGWDCYFPRRASIFSIQELVIIAILLQINDLKKLAFHFCPPIVHEGFRWTKMKSICENISQYLGLSDLTTKMGTFCMMQRTPGC